MNSNRKKWTALTAVKIASFIMILTLAFQILSKSYDIVIRSYETQISPEIILSEEQPELHFFDNMHMGSAHFHAIELLYFGSEESINAGEHLRWFEDAYGYYYLETPDRRYNYAVLGRYDTPPGLEAYSSYQTYDVNRGDYPPPSPIYDTYDIDSGESRPPFPLIDRNSQPQDLQAYSGNDMQIYESSEPFTRSSDDIWPSSEPYYDHQIIEDNYEIPHRSIRDDAPDISELRLSAEQNAIRVQLESFRNSERKLRDMDGLIYYLSRGTEISFSNVEPYTRFISQPVYLVMDSASDFVASHDYTGDRHWARHASGAGLLPVTDDMTVYLAFTNAVVNAHKEAHFSAREAYIRDFSVIAGSCISVILLLAVMLLGAGRKYSGGGVHFALIDRPFLDISLVAVTAWTVLMALLAFGTGRFIWERWEHRNYIVINVLLAASSVVILSPALLWVMSFTKRVKAGRFWQHTLIFFIPIRFFSFFKNQAKSLWSGFPLTVKVGLVSLASLLALLFMGFVGIASYHSSLILIFLAAIILTAAVAYLLLRYARRIYRLEHGAREISAGSYGQAVAAGGGELGKIADSLNSISAGINTAVEQRTKSERLKTELITNVSHDIRTPLTSIITYTDLLKHEGLNCEKAPEYLDILISKSLRLKTLTDELFEAAKAATGNIDVNLANLDLTALINQVLGELDGAVKASGLDLRVDMPESLMVRADGKLMWRVLENLLSNALKYSLPGSRVYLTTQPSEYALSPALATRQAASAQAASGNSTPGHPASGHPAPGLPASSHPAPGHPVSGHPAPGHPVSGHSAPGHPVSGHSAPGQTASDKADHSLILPPKGSTSVRMELKNVSATELNIDPNELTDRFKRGDNSRADGGSGLGLSIAQSFVAAQGGELSISIDGDLFKAIVYLPMA